MNIDTSDIWFQKFETGQTGFKFLKPGVVGFNKLPVGPERPRTSE